MVDKITCTNIGQAGVSTITAIALSFAPVQANRRSDVSFFCIFVVIQGLMNVSFRLILYSMASLLSKELLEINRPIQWVIKWNVVRPPLKEFVHVIWAV